MRFEDGRVRMSEPATCEPILDGTDVAVQLERAYCSALYLAVFDLDNPDPFRRADRNHGWAIPHIEDE